VVYDEQPGLLCVEPQSGPPDAFNIGGATRLEPGELLQRTMTIGWQRRTP
jgi:aldose 1-epimerase